MMKIVRTVALILAVVLIGGMVAASIHFRQVPTVSGADVVTLPPVTDSTNGSFPLTLENTAPGKPFVDYTVYGDVRSFNTTSPSNPVLPQFVGGSTYLAEDGGLSLSLVSSGSNGGGSTKNFFLPGVEPLRAVGTVRDELNYAGQKLTRRIGVCRTPTVVSAVEVSAGKPYPAVVLSIGGTTTPPSLDSLLSTHWTKIRGSDLTSGTVPGYAVRSGALCANLPRALYRSYVTGTVGLTEVGNDYNLIPSVAAGEYRCDFPDGTSRVFILTYPLNGIEDESGDVLAVSRTSAKLIRNMIRHEIKADDVFYVLANYDGTGETFFQFPRAYLGGDFDEDDEYGSSAICSHFEFDLLPPDALIAMYRDEPAFCGDGEYLYFHIPGVYDANGFVAYLDAQRQAGKPVTLVLPAGSMTLKTLSSYSAPTETVQSVTLLDSVSGGIVNNKIFDLASDFTIVPAFQAFLADESAAGRPAEIYFVLPEADVFEIDVELPSLPSGKGDTTFSVVSPVAGSIDPTKGYFEAYLRQ